MKCPFPPPARPLPDKSPEGMPGPLDGLLLVNLGTPDGTGYLAMRRYLKEFLSDPRVIEVNRVLWWLVLNLIILTFRPRKSGAAYARIWNQKHNASPLKVITAALAANVQAKLGKKVPVRFAMRYGQPSIPSVLDDMVAAGCTRIRVLPLYPQYAGATVGSVADALARWVLRRRYVPALEILPPYYDHPAYIGALADSVRATMKGLGWVPDVIVASFHGLPVDYVRKGDPYEEHCRATVCLLTERLQGDGDVRVSGYQDGRKEGGSFPKVIMTFQSRFGRAEWIGPETEGTLRELAASGVRNVLVICPGFATDCVETLEEIGIGAREAFLAAGGRKFALVPCLNDSAGGVEVYAGLAG